MFKMEKIIIFMFVLRIYSFCAYTDGDPIYFIEKIISLKEDKREVYIEKNFKNLRYDYNFPYIRGEEVLFVYKGIGEEVKIVGDMTFWYSSINMEKIEGTDIFYKKMNFHGEARLEYRIEVDGTLISDFLNKKVVIGKYGSNSLLEMNNYVKKEYKKKKTGKLIRKAMKSEDKKLKYNIYIYLPKSYSKEYLYKTIYFYNGIDYLNNSNVLEIMDRLNENREKIVAVFVDNNFREEYYYNSDDREINCFSDDVMEYVEKTYAVGDISDYRYVASFSENAPFVLYLASRRLDKYKHILIQSGDYSRINRKFWKKDLSVNKNMKIIILAAEYDIVKDGNRRVYSDLMKNETIKKVVYKKYYQGHTWNFWNDTLEEGIIWLLEN